MTSSHIGQRERWLRLLAILMVMGLMVLCSACGVVDPAPTPYRVLDPRTRPADFDDLVGDLRPGPTLDPGWVYPSDEGLTQGTPPAVLPAARRVLFLCNGELVPANSERVTQVMAEAQGLTVELWVRPIDTVDQRIVDAGNFALSIVRGRFLAHIGALQTIIGPAAVAQRWTHLALTFEERSLSAFFVNGLRFPALNQGAIDAWVSKNGWGALLGRLRVGEASLDGSEWVFCGWVDNVHVAAKGLQPAPYGDLTCVINDDSVFAYDFDGVAGEIQDRCGEGIDGVLRGNAVLEVGGL